MNARKLLTIILPIKNAGYKEFSSCFASICALENSDCISLIIVNSGQVLAYDVKLESYLHDISIIDVPPDGVYAAYNKALKEDLGEYVLFLGVDDLILPGLDRVLKELTVGREMYDLIACHSLMQDKGVFGGSKIRGALIFRNWCQQALLYNSRVFEENIFDIKYKMQADHKFNLELVSRKNTKILFREDVISHYSSGGISSTVNDLLFREDMPKIVKDSYGFVYWLVAIMKRKLADIIKGKPDVHV